MHEIPDITLNALHSVYILNSGSRFALVAEYITVSFGGRRVK
jgi:hypothetical protein